MTLVSSLAIGKIIDPTDKNPEKGGNFGILAITVVILLNLSPFIFGSILWKNRGKLEN